jgi:hypothetical protein
LLIQKTKLYNIFAILITIKPVKTMYSQNVLTISKLNEACRTRIDAFLREVDERIGEVIVISLSYPRKRNDISYGKCFSHYNLAVFINVLIKDERLGVKSSTKQFIDSGVIEIAKKHGVDWGAKIGADVNMFYYSPVSIHRIDNLFTKKETQREKMLVFKRNHFVVHRHDY